VTLEVVHPGLAWDASPDGQILLLSWDEGAEDPDPDDEMAAQRFLFALEGGKARRLSWTEYRHQGFATFSPDGARILFLENAEESFSPYLLDYHSGRKQPVAGDHWMLMGENAWAPGGKRFALSYGGVGNAHIRVYGAQGERWQRLGTEGASTAAFPAFLDDDTVLFITDRVPGAKPAGFLLAAQSLGDEEPVAVTMADAFAVARDGKRLAVLRRGEEGQDVVLVGELAAGLRAEGLRERVKGSIEGPLAWSPDGSLLAYRQADGLWVLDPVSGECQRLTGEDWVVLRFFWSEAWVLVFSGWRAGDAEGELQVVTVRLGR
jgi:dipeptidyl aminopeptidase/acylaminoacyl peptidase